MPKVYDLMTKVVAFLFALAAVIAGAGQMKIGARPLMIAPGEVKVTATALLRVPNTPITPDYGEPPSIASNFPISSEVHNAPVPQSALPDANGAFRFICGPGQVLADDPIVFPGQPGRSHLHQFYGNTSANAFSTYESLRKGGKSTCMSPLNRSAYWMPAMLDGKGQVVRPDYVSIYYKRFPESSPLCSERSMTCVRVPRGLRYIMGRNMLNLSKPPTGNFHFRCESKSDNEKTLGAALKNCAPGKHLMAIVDAPMCWDGEHADSPDHQSHMAYQYDTHKGYPKCPATHPYRIPTFTLSAAYLVAAGDNPGLWGFSSDAMAPGEPAGATFHADWFGAWDDSVMAMWTENCINKRLNCSDGILGNGLKLNPLKGFEMSAVPRLVPVPGPSMHP